MRPSLACRIAASLAAAILLDASNADAQVPRPAPGGPQGSMLPPRTQPPSAAPTLSPMIQVQLDQLEDELHLAKDQQPHWNRYAERVSALMDGLRLARQPGGPPPGSAVDQFGALVAAARQRVVALEQIAEAGSALYATLTPEQRDVADRRLARIVAPSVGLPGGALAR